MLFMVVERFKQGNAGAIGERFRAKGRMMPEGVIYHASWLHPSGTHCYQLMEAEHRDMLDGWTVHWNDLMDFEIVPVVTSAEFWASMRFD